jgi:hypothetical protein
MLSGPAISFLFLGFGRDHGTNPRRPELVDDVEASSDDFVLRLLLEDLANEVG